MAKHLSVFGIPTGNLKGSGGKKGEGKEVENKTTPTGGNAQQSNNATINANRNSLLTAPSITENRIRI
jgi:hypothetical protein